MQEVRAVRADKPAPLRREDVHVHPVAVDVVHEELAVVLLWPGAPLIDHRPGVGVAAPQLIRLPAVVVVPLVPRVMPVVGNRLDVVVGVGVEMLAGLPLVARAGDDVVAVGDDAGGGEEIAVLIVVEPPGVAGPLGKDLELVPYGVITPNAGVNPRSLLLRRARLADSGVCEDAVAAVEPAVGAPDEAVERLMGVFVAPAVEEDIRAERNV